MKFCSNILAFYFILLSVIPCCLFDNCVDEKKEQIENQESNDKNCGNCSPFFSCQDCSIATVAPVCLQFVFFIVEARSIPAVYIAKSLPRINYDFWQPPKLVSETPSV